MKIIAAVENRMGMVFNQRRVSKDRQMIADVKKQIGKANLFVSPESADLFGQDDFSIIEDPDFLEQAKPDDWCFVENHSLQGKEKEVDAVILYRWNRDYPSDVQFDLDLSGYKLISSEDFKGSSHEKITREWYAKA